MIKFKSFKGPVIGDAARGIKSADDYANDWMADHPDYIFKDFKTCYSTDYIITIEYDDRTHYGRRLD